MSDPANPMTCSPPGSSVHGISRARILDWIAISFSRASFQTKDQTQVSALQADAEPLGKPGSAIVLSSFSHVRLFVTHGL